VSNILNVCKSNNNSVTLSDTVAQKTSKINEYNHSCNDSDTSELIEDGYYDDSNDANDTNDTEESNEDCDTNDDNTGKKRTMKMKKMELNEAVKTVNERSMYTKIDRFFKRECSEKNIAKMIKIINNEDPISLRLLNWFGMKHSSTMESLDIAKKDGHIELFDVKISYDKSLSTYSKKYFDPFRRGKRFDYNYGKSDPTKIIETTLCQLNFFRWLFMYDLMEYVENHYDTLKVKMGAYNVVEKKKKETKKEKGKKTIVKNKTEDVKFRVKQFEEEDNSKLIIYL
jgi:hypothetical protein